MKLSSPFARANRGLHRATDDPVETSLPNQIQGYVGDFFRSQSGTTDQRPVEAAPGQGPMPARSTGSEPPRGRAQPRARPSLSETKPSPSTQGERSHATAPLAFFRMRDVTEAASSFVVGGIHHCPAFHSRVTSRGRCLIPRLLFRAAAIGPSSFASTPILIPRLLFRAAAIGPSSFASTPIPRLSHYP